MKRLAALTTLVGLALLVSSFYRSLERDRPLPILCVNPDCEEMVLPPDRLVGGRVWCDDCIANDRVLSEQQFIAKLRSHWDNRAAEQREQSPAARHPR